MQFHRTHVVGGIQVSSRLDSHSCFFAVFYRSDDAIDVAVWNQMQQARVVWMRGNRLQQSGDGRLLAPIAAAVTAVTTVHTTRHVARNLRRAQTHFLGTLHIFMSVIQPHARDCYLPKKAVVFVHDEARISAISDISVRIAVREPGVDSKLSVDGVQRL